MATDDIQKSDEHEAIGESVEKAPSKTVAQSTTSHTPAPWEVQHNARLEIVSTVELYKGCGWHQGVAHVYRAGKMNGTNYRMPAEANARLIAAAPELLEACQAAIEGLHAMQECWCAYLSAEYRKRHGSQCGPCKVRAAIAKAEG